jgi:hypothetical protein
VGGSRKVGSMRVVTCVRGDVRVGMCWRGVCGCFGVVDSEC